jgi:hypothetical protein
MEKVDLVLVGAHGVVESGGIINKLGTSTVAIVAAAMNKPLYVAVESHKFVRIFPINQARWLVRGSSWLATSHACMQRTLAPPPPSGGGGSSGTVPAARLVCCCGGGGDWRLCEVTGPGALQRRRSR